MTSPWSCAPRHFLILLVRCDVAKVSTFTIRAHWFVSKQKQRKTHESFFFIALDKQLKTTYRFNWRKKLRKTFWNKFTGNERRKTLLSLRKNNETALKLKFDACTCFAQSTIEIGFSIKSASCRTFMWNSTCACTDVAYISRLWNDDWLYLCDCLMNATWDL